MISGETTDSFQLNNSKYSSSFCCLGIFFSHTRGTHTQRDGVIFRSIKSIQNFKKNSLDIWTSTSLKRNN